MHCLFLNYADEFRKKKMEYWVAKFDKTPNFKHFLARLEEINMYDIEILRLRRRFVRN